jgi:hypothetical protein
MREHFFQVEVIQVAKKASKRRCIASVLSGKRICSSGCKECKRAHPNLVFVRD